MTETPERTYAAAEVARFAHRIAAAAIVAGWELRATIDAICGGEAVPEADKRAALDGIDSRFSEARLRTILEREKK